MTWKIEVSNKFEKYYLKLSAKEKSRIKGKLNELKELNNPLLHKDVRLLTGDLRGFYRMRIGESRVIFSLITETRTIAVVNLFPRSQGY
jgi:mRNA-degrading endonuclease RelE of RelBE toxin-antitoxin system